MLETLTLLLSLALGGVLLVSGVAKLYGTANERTWELLISRAPRPLRALPARPMSWAHVGAELAVGVLLLFGHSVRVPALLAATCLFGAFTAVALYSARARNPVPCSCFGRGATTLKPRHVGRNAALTLMGASALVLNARSAEALTPGQVMLAVAVAVVVTALVWAFDDIAHLLNSRA
jgi:uncharacterized membrane protein YphA (DoxX/SURF4 family)